MSEDKLNSIKQQQKLEINKLNKFVNDSKLKKQALEEEYKKKEENLNKTFQEKQEKINNKLNKREARKIKKIKKKQTNTFSTQTDTIKVEMRTMEIQTEPDLKPTPQDFTIIKETIQNSIDKFLIHNTTNTSIQCNLVEEQPVIQSEKEVIIKKTNDLDIDFYLLSFFRRIHKDNKGIKKILHINENIETIYRRDMLGAFDTNEDIYKILFTAQYSGDIKIKFYSGEEELFFIVYNHNHKKSNQFRIHSLKYRNINGTLKKIDMKFREFYKIELEGSNNKYMIKFNGQDILEIEIDQKIKFFASKNNFKVTYN